MKIGKIFGTTVQSTNPTRKEIFDVDFYKIRERSIKRGVTEVFPEFIVGRSKDLMVRGGDFYAIWDESTGYWSTDEYDVARLIDKELYEYSSKLRQERDDIIITKMMSDFSSNCWSQFKKYTKQVSDNYHQLDAKVIFSNTEVSKTDYVSKRLSYPLQKGKCKSYDKIMSTLYSPEERQKIEWAIGAIITGDSKKIQKFLVLFGDAGTGKSTVLNIIQKLFDGYYTMFEAKALASNNNSFSTEIFKNDPLVAIQHDGDLSRIEDNTKLNSIISHEKMAVNEKFKSTYVMKFNCFLFMATNKPVKITDAKSGIIRRLIDVRPTGKKLDPDTYEELYSSIDFELPAIADHCMHVYLGLGHDYYNSYRPIDMMYRTDPFFNFVEDSYLVFKEQNATTLKAAYAMYKKYCDDACLDFKIPMHKFRDELKNYFAEFYEQYWSEDRSEKYRSYYTGFLTHKFERENAPVEKKKKSNPFIFEEQVSLLDKVCADCPAQLTREEGTPKYKWENVTTKLKDIPTTELHYLKVPENHIVIDFDLKDETGAKSFERNLEAVSKWPLTYAELSKSGAGIHLHYIYTGDVSMLSRIYDEDIEIKVFTGNSSLRRKLSKCNDIPIAEISSGLPLKEKGDKMVNFESIKNEAALRTLIKKNLNKEIHANTKPSICFIHDILEDAYNSGLHYDVTNMRPAILAFANGSSHQAEACIKLVNDMKFKSEETSDGVTDATKPLVFFDLEVYPNHMLFCHKVIGEGQNISVNWDPSPQYVEKIISESNLIGYNCRRYDNHILYGAMMGYNNEQIYSLSARIIEGSSNCFFGEAYNISYTDIYDYSTKKQSLKKWEIELGIHHQEMGIPWDKPLPDDMMETVAGYCCNDVLATEAVWNATQADFLAREILVNICKESGVDACVNDTTNSLTTKIIFGRERHPELVYTNLEETFPGYEFVDGHNMYNGEDASFGGYVYAEPGIYGNVALLDIASMHPHSIIAMNCFGEYTERFEDLVNARILIKHHDYDKARKLLNGALAPYLEDESMADKLSKALKIPINSVYGLTSAKFDNPFRDPRNVNNIVALRGALFMMTLKKEVQKRGFTVAHIKTDSIKIPDATPEIIDFCMDFAKKYGYTFEHEATYEKICLVNDAVYIAKDKADGHWTATGAQFQIPYVFKTLFSHEPIEFRDLCETKQVSSEIYLDFNEGLPDVSMYENEYWERKKGKPYSDARLQSTTDEELEELVSKGHKYEFVGKIGSFCPMVPGVGAGYLLRKDPKTGKMNAVTGTKGYLWYEAEVVQKMELEDSIDMSYFRKLVDNAVDEIGKYGDFEWFASDDPYIPAPFAGGKIC